MEQDIKILENYIELINKGYCLDCNELCNIYSTPAFPPRAIALAIEKLIKERQLDKERIKELEERIKIYALNGDNIKLELYIKNNYIPKSLIKEKIEELKQQEKEELKGMKGQDRYFVKQIYQYKIQVLEELLGEEK